jgi:UMF1 family MFS transporter
VPNRKPVLAWLAYDFANSAFVAVVPATVYAKYYALRVVGNEHGRGDLWWGWAVTTAMAIVALSAPFLGAIADRAGLRRRFLAAFTYLSVVATALLASVRPGDVLWGWVLAVVAIGGAEAAFVHYNAYLPGLVPDEQQGRLSAHGFAVGYVGSAFALAAAYPLVGFRISAAFLITAALFGLFALPALRYLPADRPIARGISPAARGALAQVRNTVRDIRGHPALGRFLVAYLFFEDGVNTVVYFSAIFAGHTLGFTTSEVIELYFVVQLSALAGAWAWAERIDTWGPKRVVQITLVQWCLVVVAASLVQTKLQYFVLATVAGTALGAVQAASRTFMATLIPRGQEAELFGFYALCGRAASICGPAVFGIVSRLTDGNQRVAILVVGIFFVVGLAAVSGVRAGGPTTARTKPPG